jgi:hypothetical protein
MHACDGHSPLQRDAQRAHDRVLPLRVFNSINPLPAFIFAFAGFSVEHVNHRDHAPEISTADP